jgi:hypothetical protein
MEEYTQQLYMYDFGTYMWNPNHHYKFCRLTPVIGMDGTNNDILGTCRDVWYTAVVNLTENHTLTVNRTSVNEFRHQYVDQNG